MSGYCKLLSWRNMICYQLISDQHNNTEYPDSYFLVYCIYFVYLCAWRASLTDNMINFLLIVIIRAPPSIPAFAVAPRIANYLVLSSLEKCCRCLHRSVDQSLPPAVVANTSVASIPTDQYYTRWTSSVRHAFGYRYSGFLGRLHQGADKLLRMDRRIVSPSLLIRHSYYVYLRSRILVVNNPGNYFEYVCIQQLRIQDFFFMGGAEGDNFSYRGLNSSIFPHILKALYDFP